MFFLFSMLQVLDETINVMNFDSFKQADVYSFGLVLWETGRRCLTGGLLPICTFPIFLFHILPPIQHHWDQRVIR